MLEYKPGDIVCFKQDLLTHIDSKLLVPAHMPVEISNINTNTIWIYLPNIHTGHKTSRKHNFRYIPERMYFATPAGRLLYG